MNNNKKIRYNGDLLLPSCPTVLVTTRYIKDNVLTVSWAGIASSHPEHVTIAINSKRYSHDALIHSGKFCINIPNANLIKEVDYCGTYSGREIDKFKACGFSKLYMFDDYVLIEQCPMHLLCTVKTIVNLGSHDLFIGSVDEKLIDSDSINSINETIDPIIYKRPNYFRLQNDSLGYYGFTKEDYLK